MEDKRIFETADKLKAAKERKKVLDAETKAVSAEIEQLDHDLSDLMAEAECDKFSHSGSTFYLSSRLFASPKAGMKEDMIAALRQHGYGGIVTETVNANTMSSLAKELSEGNDDKLPEWLSDVVNSYEKVSVGIRKGSKFNAAKPQRRNARYSENPSLDMKGHSL